MARLGVGGAERRNHWRNPVLAVAVIAAVISFVPRASTAGEFQTVDEVSWMYRSFAFSEAILGFDPAAATVPGNDIATMPGVTTMWLGTAARDAWRLTGDRDPGTQAFVSDDDAVELTQLAMALATSALIAIFVALAWLWTGPIPAVAAGALLASEPFLVAHGAVLHTDELTGLFGAAGSIALLHALGWPHENPARPTALAILAGALLAGAFLTKLSAGALVPGLAAVVVGFAARDALVARRANRSVAPSLRRVGRTLAIAAAAGAITAVLLWPALWADPVAQFDRMLRSAELASAGHLTFFLGEITTTPGPLFYAVTTPLRMTPWLSIGTLAFVPIAFLSSRWRGHAVALAGVVVPALVVLALAAKQFDRYVIALLPWLILIVGLGLDVALRALHRRFLGTSAGTRRSPQAAWRRSRSPSTRWWLPRGEWPTTTRCSAAARPRSAACWSAGVRAWSAQMPESGSSRTVDAGSRWW